MKIYVLLFMVISLSIMVLFTVDNSNNSSLSRFSDDGTRSLRYYRQRNEVRSKFSKCVERIDMDIIKNNSGLFINCNFINQKVLWVQSYFENTYLAKYNLEKFDHNSAYYVALIDFYEEHQKTESYYKMVAEHGMTKGRMISDCLEANVCCVFRPSWLHDNIYGVDDGPHSELNSTNEKQSATLQWFSDSILSNLCAKVVLTHSDVFIVKSIANFINDLMNDNSAFFGIKQDKNGIYYLYESLMMIDLNKIQDFHYLDFSPGVIKNIPVDVSGHLYFYLEFYKPGIRFIDVRINDDNTLVSPECPYKWSKIIKEYYYNDTFMHMATWGNWEYHDSHYIDCRMKVLQHMIF